MRLCVFGFTPDPMCTNCYGTGVFATDEFGRPEEACAFCLEDAIKGGEIDGMVDGVEHKNGLPFMNEEQKKRSLDPKQHCFRENNCIYHPTHEGPTCCCCGCLPEEHGGCDCEPHSGS